MIISASYSWQARNGDSLPPLSPALSIHIPPNNDKFYQAPNNDKLYQDANFFSLFDTCVHNKFKGVLAKKFKGYFSQIKQKNDLQILTQK